MKQLILSCFLVLRLSEHKVSMIWPGAEAMGWNKNAVDFVIPISCNGFDKINVGDDFLQSRWLRQIVRGNPKNWEVKVIRKIVREDNETEFSCF